MGKERGVCTCAAGECTPCHLFRCVMCGEMTPWGDGAADDMPESCNACWVKTHDEIRSRLGLPAGSVQS